MPGESISKKKKKFYKSLMLHDKGFEILGHNFKSGILQHRKIKKIIQCKLLNCLLHHVPPLSAFLVRGENTIKDVFQLNSSLEHHVCC